MRFRKLIPPIPIIVSLALALVAVYVVRKMILEWEHTSATLTRDAEKRVKPFSTTPGPQGATELDNVIGPVFGWFDYKTFTVAAVADMPAEWSVTLDKPGFTIKPLRPQSECCQTFEITRSDPAALPAPLRVTCTIHARLPSGPREVERSGQATVGPLGPRWSFVALGDSRTNVEVERWSSVIAAAARRNPAFIVHSGDFVNNGREFRQWKHQFWEPARKELASIPLYGVIGNHEFDTVLFDRILTLPGTRDCWVQTQGPVLMIGIDGSRDWSETSALYRGLETLLEESRARFILVFSHYPPLSSSDHSDQNGAGEYVEESMRSAHDRLLPLCVKYRVTAFVAGHDHCYERSDFPGLSIVTSGGAGAPTYAQAHDAGKRNPHSRRYHAGLHYLFFTVTSDELRMEAATPDGQVLDTLTWKPRPGSF